jgi:hypothetical protein
MSWIVGQKKMAISPWDSFARQESPDGRYVAVYDGGMEIAMGGPTHGLLKITEKKSGDSVIELSDANGSFVWSSDSGALALPRWIPGRNQKLVVVRLDTGRHESTDGEYRVLELSSFVDGVVIGIDSPIHRPVEICVSVKR